MLKLLNCQKKKSQIFHQHFESIWAKLTKIKQHKNSEL
jgi:hypothetical protein